MGEVIRLRHESTERGEQAQRHSNSTIQQSATILPLKFQLLSRPSSVRRLRVAGRVLGNFRLSVAVMRLGE
jgi:hypothetical protein